MPFSLTISSATLVNYLPRRLTGSALRGIGCLVHSHEQSCAAEGIAVLIEMHNFELEIDARLFYLRADVGRHRLEVFKMWREPWRHADVEWYDRAKRNQEMQARQKARSDLDRSAHEEASRAVEAATLATPVADLGRDGSQDVAAA